MSRMTVKNIVNEEVLIEEGNENTVNLLINIKLPKKTYSFMEQYCYLSNMKLSVFINSMMMHSLYKLMRIIDWKEQKKIFRKLGVR